MQNVKVVIGYRFFFVFICTIGVIFGILDKSADSFMGSGTALYFYTLQSNIWVLLLEVYLLFKSILKSNLTSNEEAVKYVVTVAIVLTYLVYWLMIAPFLNDTLVVKPHNFILHGICPLMMLLDFLVFDREVMISKRATYLTLIPALYYFIFTYIRAEVSPVRLTLGSRYPYWFLDIDTFRLVRERKRCRSYFLDMDYTIRYSSTFSYFI